MLQIGVLVLLSFQSRGIGPHKYKHIDAAHLQKLKQKYGYLYSRLYGMLCLHECGERLICMAVSLGFPEGVVCSQLIQHIMGILSIDLRSQAR